MTKLLGTHADTRRIFLVLPLVVVTSSFLCLSGCKSLKTREDVANGDAGSGSSISSEFGDGVTGDVDDADEVKTALVDSGVRESSHLDRKYALLAKAVRAGRSKAMMAETSKILGKDQNDAVALNTLALYYFRTGKPGAAKILLTRALEKNQKSAALYNNLAVVLLEEGDPMSAMLNLSKALKIEDNHPEALGNLGSLYAQSGNYIKAIVLLEKAYKENRANLAIANNYAVALRANKNYDGAMRIYEDILKRNSRDVAALLNYAILLIDFMNKPKDGLALVYKVKFLEMERKDIVSRANALEKKAKAGLQ